MVTEVPYKMYQNTLETIPDSAKVAGAIAAPGLAFFGIGVEDWGYILSAIVSIMFIIEKIPTFLMRLRAFVNWLKETFRD